MPGGDQPSHRRSLRPSRIRLVVGSASMFLAVFMTTPPLRGVTARAASHVRGITSGASRLSRRYSSYSPAFGTVCPSVSRSRQTAWGVLPRAFSLSATQEGSVEASGPGRPDEATVGSEGEQVEKRFSRPRRTSTGGLKNLPVMAPANEQISHALRAIERVKIDEDKVKNPRLRAKKLGALRLDTLMTLLSKPLKYVMKAYEYELGVLHPFEATLADLTVRARVKQGCMTLDEVLEEVNGVRKQLLITGKAYAAQVRNATTKAEAVEASEAGIKALTDIMTQESAAILNLIEVQKSLRKLPIVSLSTPMVVLVGAPNVGKSSIVRAISSGTPEVNDYPFTTRGMTLGHIQYDDFDVKCQVMDTPGVLNRPDEQRNEMEALTLASMQHLPTAVMFVLDLTGHSGALSSIENQIKIRNDLRKRFPKRPWVDVVSKADLPTDSDDPAVQLAPEGAIHVSVADGTGIPELKVRVREMLVDIRDLLDIYIAKQRQAQEQDEIEKERRRAERAARALQ